MVVRPELDLVFQMVPKRVQSQAQMSQIGTASAVGLDETAELQPWRSRLRRVVGDHGGVTAVSRLAEIPRQTLKNHLSGRTKNAPLDDLRRIADACGVEFAWLAAIEGQPAGFAERDVVPLRDHAASPNRFRWAVRSRVLELAGYLPGDVIEFDMGRTPRAGEPVVAQVYDDDIGGADTVLRIYRPPFLTAHSADPAVSQEPILLDQDGTAVKIMGGFVQMVRKPQD